MITFFSNFINDHQIPFCEAMYRRTNGEFRFVATQTISEERLKLGFQDKSSEFPFVVNAFDAEGEKKALKLADESDVVIWGDAPLYLIKERLSNDLLTFRYTERYFKRGKWRIFDPRVFKSLYFSDIKYRKNKNLYLLCASAYTAPDCRFIGCYKNKAYKWGYFPNLKKYDDIDTVVDGKVKNSLLFVGRLIDWKRPEFAVKIAKRLKKDGYEFMLDMIGVGNMQEKIKRLIHKNGLDDCVSLLGSMSPEKVRLNMEKAEIFLFTSNKQEGWGAVLNESMNSACAVIASGEIGSVPYLIEDGKTGFSFKNKNDLYKKVKYLLDNPERRKTIGINAYKTMTETWNAETAADRFLTLIQKIKDGKDTPYNEGPCSKD